MSDPVVIVDGGTSVVEITADPEILSIEAEPRVLVVEAPYTLPAVPASTSVYVGEALPETGWVPPFWWYKPSTGHFSLVLAGGAGEPSVGFSDLFSDLFID